MKKLAPLAALALLAAPVALAGEINVSYDPEFAEKLQDEYGAREGEYLTHEIQEDLTRQLSKAKLDIPRIDVTILDAKPNKPTFKQLGDTPGLDYSASKSIGGMKLSAVAYDADGNPTGDLTYKWYETDIRLAGISTWQDAQRASDKFSRKFVKELTAGKGGS
ncbi:MAG: hypothetical protein CMF04_05910 [Hyphomonas sp.]|nr:hypothetical protein [Hyphomonas sp.]|tara:strand:- start:3542 stop:4030 length:489 start_codon:yes stop_codon:yes gene_type:complete